MLAPVLYGDPVSSFKCEDEGAYFCVRDRNSRHANGGGSRPPRGAKIREQRDSSGATERNEERGERLAFFFAETQRGPRKVPQQSEDTLWGKAAGTNGVPAGKISDFSRGAKSKHPTDFCGVLLMMPCGCVELLTGFVRSEATE